MAPSLAQRLFGTEEPVEPDLPLRAGPLSLQLRRGKLLHLCCNGVEVWHGLAFVLRDPDWGTPEPVIEQQTVEVSDGGFRVRLAGHFPVSPPVALQIDIEATADGGLRYEAQALPAGDIDCNRLGLCLMHPSSAAGAAVEVRHVDGRSSRSTLPELVPPWPPFMLMRGIAHEWAPGCWAEAELLGDSFELEDQRNNADASFKTYSRSNLMPRPYRLPGGVPVVQSARLWLRTPPPAAVAPRADPIVALAVGAPCGALPVLGIEIHPQDTRDGGLEEAVAALKQLRPAHLHLALRGPADVADGGAAGLAALLDAARARLRLDLEGDADAARLATLAPSAVAVFPSSDDRIAAARQCFPGARVGGGTPHYFAQLHRLDRLGAVDFVSFTTSPLVHGADDDQVMQGLASLPALVATLHARWPGAPVQVGPSTIGVRRSPLGGQPASDGRRRLALAAQDPRCRAQFGAAWALGYIAAFAACGVEALTLMSLGGASALQERGRLTPAGHLLAAIAPGSAQRLQVHVEGEALSGRIAVLAFAAGDRATLLVANLDAQATEVAVGSFNATRLERLDADSEGWRPAGEPPVQGHLALPAYGVARLSR